MSTRITAIFVRLLLCSGLLLGLLIIPTPVTPAYATTLVVTTDADSGAGSLRQAIGDAAAGDTITFSGDFTITLSSTLTITQDLTIDGAGHAITIDGNHAVRVFALNSGTITLNQLNIVNGYLVSTALPWSSGAGIAVDGATLNVANSTFSGNVTGPLGGGALHLQSGTANITNCAFISNSAVSGSTGSGGTGGAIQTESGTTLNLANSTFSGNTAGNSGGGMYNVSSSPTLTNVTFFSNTAGAGGAIYNMVSDPMLTNVTFSDNSAQLGGGMFNFVSRPTLANVTFSGNSATQDGGGMYNASGDAYAANNHPTLTNVTFSGNSATRYGGGMYSSYLSPALTNVTVSGNSAGTSGGGMYNSNSKSPIRNSLFWGNSGGEIINLSSTPPISDSVVEGGYPEGVNIITADPLLGTLGYYGGSAATIPLLPGSSAIDAGNGAYCTVGSDQRGKDYVGPCDIGAFESQGFTLTRSGGDGQSTPLSTTFATPLSVMVTANNIVEPVNGGQVTFKAPSSGASTNPMTNTATIASGVVSQTLSANGTTGPYTVSAGAAGAMSVTFTLTNLKGSTTTSLTSSPNPSTLGQSVTFTATVSSAGGVPTGVVTFTLGATIMAMPLNNAGTAMFSMPSLSAGNHPVSAQYGGDSNFSMSSATLNGGQAVNDIHIIDLSAINSSPTKIGFTTAFTATISAGSNVIYTWDFGDGQTASGAQVNHRYAQTGAYTATVTATNGVGSINATTLVTIEPARLYLPLVLRR